MAEIQFQDVTKRYGDGFEAVKHFNLDVQDGELIVLVGPSGCGKSTALRMVAGLEDITDGELKIAGEVVNDKAPKDRDIAMVFQNYALYPHMTVRQNMGFALKLAKVPESEIDRKVTEAAKILDLEAHLDRKPANLSGGQRQRVAMGRAIVRDPAVFLMDEPLSNLDAKLRVQTRTEISRIQQRLKTTMIYVTHDQTEALTLGDRLAVMRSGVLQQVGPPGELYSHPVNLFVAGFIGSPPMNFLPAQVDGRRVSLPFVDFELAEAPAGDSGESRLLIAGIRPEHFEDASLLDATDRGRGVTFKATVDVTEWLGAEQYAYIPFEAPEAVTNQLRNLAQELDSESIRTQLVVSVDTTSHIREGGEAQLWFDPAKVQLFDPASGDNLTPNLAAAPT
jgi:multiple sugar transport system ATP-binding protein